MNLVEKDCVLCGPEQTVSDLYEQTFTEDDLTPAVYSARRETEHYHYKMVKCDCGMIFSRNILPEDKIWDLYTESTFNFGDYTPVLRQDYWKHIARFIDAPEKASALEIGCSSGFFLEELKARGFTSVTGCEPSRHARESAHPSVRENILLSEFHGRKTFPKQTFDLVCVFHTLDHLTDPATFIRDCTEVLSENGLLYIVVHDVNSLQLKLLGEKSPIIDIEHIYLFNRSTLGALLKRAGMEPVCLARFWNSYPLRYWIRMFPMKSAFKEKLVRALEWIGLAGLRIPIPAGNIFAVARVARRRA